MSVSPNETWIKSNEGKKFPPLKPSPYAITAREMLKDATFVELCELRGVKPSKRQVSKYRNSTGRFAKK